MENPLEAARRVLARHDAPALPYTELHHLVSSEIAGPAPRSEQLLRRVRGRPDLFRTLDPRRGAWTTLAKTPRGSDGRPWLEPWVLLAGRDEAPGTRDNAHGSDTPPMSGVDTGENRHPLPRVRETVLHLGRSLDPASPTSLFRWLLIVREEGAIRKRIFNPDSRTG